LEVSYDMTVMYTRMNKNHAQSVASKDISTLTQKIAAVTSATVTIIQKPIISEVSAMIDVCKFSGNCDTNAKCINTGGDSFICECNAGHFGPGTSCTGYGLVIISIIGVIIILLSCLAFRVLAIRKEKEKSKNQVFTETRPEDIGLTTFEGTVVI